MKPSDSLDQQIVQAYADVVRKEKIIIHLAHLKEQIAEERIRLDILQKTMEQEQADYLRLEKVGIHRFFAALTDKEGAKLDREKQEFLLAYVKHQECKKELEQRIQEQKILMDTLYHLFDVEKKLDRLLIEKRKKLIPNSNTYQIAIADLDEQIIRQRLQLEEIQEAHAVGKKVLPALQEIIDELVQVQKRGAFDYAGKGRYSSFKKKKFIERSIQAISKLHTQLRHFEEELHDVSQHYQLPYEEQLSLFKDFIADFLQNLVTDWGVKREIGRSLKAIRAIAERIKATLKNLDADAEKARLLLVNKQEEVKALLLEMAKKKEA